MTKRGQQLLANCWPSACRKRSPKGGLFLVLAGIERKKCGIIDGREGIKMLVKNAENREQFEFVSLENMVPQDHLLREDRRGN